MHFSVITIFPELFDGFWKHGMIRRAMEAGAISGSTVNPRDFTTDRHRTTDDRPYGGGAGMVMKPEPLAAAITSARQDNPGAATVLLTPQGKSFTQDAAAALAAHEGLILVCGRYEGVDERIGENYIDLDLSIGDFVLTGGELAAMMVIDAVTRLVPGVLGNEESAEQESFSQDLLEHDHFTRPRLFEDQEVPEVLLSGNHQDIARWRLETSLIRTVLRRPDMLENRNLTPDALQVLKTWQATIEAIIRSQS